MSRAGNTQWPKQKVGMDWTPQTTDQRSRRVTHAQLWWHRTWGCTDGPLHFVTPGVEIALGLGLLDTHGFISAHRRSETPAKMVIRLPEWILLFWELNCRKNLLSRWDTHDYRWGSVRRIQWWSEMKFHAKGKKNPKQHLVIPGMGKVCFWLGEDWGLEDPCMRPDGVLGHERSWWQWFVAPFLGYSLQFTKTLLFPRSTEILCMSCAKKANSHPVRRMGNITL